MTKFNIKNISYLTLILLVLISLWLIFNNKVSIFKKGALNNYDTFMTNIHGIKLDKLGNPHEELYSPDIKHYVKDNTTITQKPYTIFYGKGAPPWHIHADKSRTIHGNQKVFMIGHVRARQLPGKNSHNATFTTTKATIYPNKSLMVTDQPVTIIRPSSVIHGIGMRADLNKNKIKILSQTQTFYHKPGK